MFEGCPACATSVFRSGLTPDYDYAALASELRGRPLADKSHPGIWRYRHLLPVERDSNDVSLGEGNTPLVAMPRIAAALEAADVWIKDESRNPTWSYKDRNVAVAVAKAVEFGAETIVGSTSGNHGLALAAYAARARLRCVIATYVGVPERIRLLLQAYGAEVIVMDRPEERWEYLRTAVSERGWYPATNLTDIPTNSAYGHDGYKTIAYEIFDELRDVPEIVAVPTAYAEGLYGIWKGFDELVTLGLSSRRPRMVACESAEGPLSSAIAHGDGKIARVRRPPTIARGIAGTVNSYIGVAAIRESGGVAVSSDDGRIRRAYRDLAREGLLVEPAAATSLAGVRTLADKGGLAIDQRIVLISTSSGLKDDQTLGQEFDDVDRASAAPGTPTLERTA